MLAELERSPVLSSADFPPSAMKQLAGMFVIASNKMELVGTDDEQSTMDVIEGAVVGLTHCQTP